MADIGDVKRLAVIGSGIMGTGITEISLLGGYETVVLSDIDGSALKKSRAAIESAIGALHRSLQRTIWSCRPHVRSSKIRLCFGKGRVYLKNRCKGQNRNLLFYYKIAEISYRSSHVSLF